MISKPPLTRGLFADKSGMLKHYCWTVEDAGPYKHLRQGM